MKRVLFKKKREHYSLSLVDYFALINAVDFSSLL